MMSTMKKFHTGISVIVSIIIVISLYLWLKGDLFGADKIRPGKVAYEGPALKPDAQTMTAELREVPVTIEAPGTLNALYSTNISSKIVAAIIRIHPAAGDMVKQGDLLIELDDRDITARLNQAKNELTAAESNLSQAEADFKRHNDLFSQGVESRQMYDQYETALKVARALVEQAKAAVKEAEVMLSYSRIYAPYEGRITDKLLDEGETAMPGQPILKMYNPSRLRLEANVEESLQAILKPGDSLTVHIDAVDCEAKGIVEEIVPSADVLSRTFIARVSVPCEGRLYEGMFGRLIIPTGVRKAILVPQSALYYVGQLEMMKVVSDDGGIERRVIKTGQSFNGNVEVLSGLNAGEKFILNP